MMHEELIKQMRFCAEDHSVVECAEKCPYGNAERQHGYCFLDLMATAADAIEELELACNRYEKDYKALCEYLPKWIPVTERLPDAASGDVSGRVLVTDGKDVAIAEWFNFEECKPFWSYTGFGKDVTHWMPLPEPPKEE